MNLNLRKMLIYILQRIYKFNDWHLSLLDERPYALEVVRECSKLYNTGGVCVVEIGCGIGEIIGHIHAPNSLRYGYDINEANIKAGRIMNRNVCFRLGTFGDVDIGKIDCLIMVDFTFIIEPQKLAYDMKELLSRNDVKRIVIDTYRNNVGTEYTYSHSGNMLFGEEYFLNKRSRGFRAAHGARRYIEYWEKK